MVENDLRPPVGGRCSFNSPHCCGGDDDDYERNPKPSARGTCGAACWNWGRGQGQLVVEHGLSFPPFNQNPPRDPPELWQTRHLDIP
jgi:hypothetical protein